MFRTAVRNRAKVPLTVQKQGKSLEYVTICGLNRDLFPRETEISKLPGQNNDEWSIIP